MGLIFLVMPLMVFASAIPVVDLVPKGSMISLSEVDDSILIEMRYASSHNFVGEVIDGYLANKCFVSLQAAKQLKQAQAKLLEKGYSLKVYDCYRPHKATQHFVRWAKDLTDVARKKSFYPNVEKKDLFKLGYIASRSGHSAGSTVDLTLVKLPAQSPAVFDAAAPQVECTAPASQRHDDGSVDMGTGYDCFDAKAATMVKTIPNEAMKNRILLKTVMQEVGFVNYSKEWWHYTLQNEPFKGKIFDFDVQ